MDQIIPDYITWRMKKKSLVCRIHFTTRKRLFLLINFASMPGDNFNDIQACTRTCLSRRRGFRWTIPHPRDWKQEMSLALQFLSLLLFSSFSLGEIDYNTNSFPELYPCSQDAINMDVVKYNATVWTVVNNYTNCSGVDTKYPVSSFIFSSFLLSCVPSTTLCRSSESRRRLDSLLTVDNPSSLSLAVTRIYRLGKLLEILRKII